MSELLERICKVRRLARQSPEAGERKNAEEKLAQLLEKHRISEADLDRHDSKAAPFGVPPPAQPQWGSVVVEIMPGFGFGSVFGFGHGFSVHFTGFPGNTSTGTSTTGV